MAMRCFCPPLRLTPRCPTMVSYPSGNAVMNSWAWAVLAASTTSSSEASGLPYFMLSVMVPLKRIASWRLIPMWLLRLSILMSLTSTPSRVTRPSLVS